MNKLIERPNCPKCGKPMRLYSTGSAVRMFGCDDCKETEIVKREDIGDERP